MSDTNTATRAHHPDSPSSLQSSEACPAFLNEQRESQASTDGTLQHSAVERRDLSLLNGDESMEWAVQQAINYEDAILQRFKLDGRPFRVLREVLLSVGDDRVTEGYPDTVIVADTHAAILDWKFGKVAVTPTADNLQGIAYALGLLKKFPELKTVEVHFFAPYQKWSEQEQREKYVHCFHWDHEAVDQELRVRAVIARKHTAALRVQEGDWAMAQPKHDLCIWCARKGECPKVAALVVKANQKYADLEVPAEMKSYRLTSPEQVASAYKFANQLTPILEAIKKRCIDASLTEGLLPPNFILVKSQHRKVKSTQGFLNVAVERGLTPEEAVSFLSVSFKPFEDAIKAKASKGKGALALREFNSALEESGVTELGNVFYFLREAKTPAEKPVPAIDI